MTYLSNNQAIILFFILFGLTAYSWVKVISLGGDVRGISQLEAQFLIVTGLLFIPSTILGMMINIGSFKQAVKV